MTNSKPTTLGELRRSAYPESKWKERSVKDELRENLLDRLKKGGPLFQGIIGYDDTVIPQVVNAILSKQNFILLGLRGQAKSRLLRSIADLLDEEIPVVAGCEINDNPYAPICRSCRTSEAATGCRARITCGKRGGSSGYTLKGIP